MPHLPRRLRLSLAALAVVTLAACSTKEGRIESGLKKGTEFVRTGELDKASIEVRNVLQIDPKNAQAYFIAGRVAETQRNIQQAYGAYVKAVELKPEMLEAKVAVARMYVFALDPENAKKTLAEVLAKDPANVDARTLVLAVRAGEGGDDTVLAEARSLVKELKSVPADTAMVLAGLLVQRDQRREALEVVELALRDDPKNAALLQVAANVSASAPQGDAAAGKAVDYLKRATDAAPRNSALWRAWADYHLARRENDKAEAVLRDAIARAPDDATRRSDLTTLLERTKGVDAAEAEFKAQIKADARDNAARFGLVRLYAGANRHGQARQVLEEIAAGSEDAQARTSAKVQLASYDWSSGRSAEARARMTEILQASPRENGALLLRARFHLLDGNPRDAINDLRGVVRDQPASAEAVDLLAFAHRQAGEPELAREVLGEAVKFKPEAVELRALLIRDLMDSRLYDRALVEADAALKLAPDLRLYDLKSQIALAQRNTALAERTVAEARDRFPRVVDAHLMVGRLLARLNRPDAAIKAYDAAALLQPADPAPYIASVGLLMAQKQWDQASARVAERAAREPQNGIHLKLAADIALQRGDLPGAEKAYKRLVEEKPGVAFGWLGSAQVLGQRGDFLAAAQLLAEAEKKVPGDASVALARTEWLMRAGQFDQAIAAYEAMLAAGPVSDPVLNNLAYLLVEKKGDRPSLERAAALTQRLSLTENASYLDTVGWIQHRLGAYDKAVPLLQRAVALAPDAPLLQLHYGKALVKSGEVKRGQQALRRAIESKAPLPNLDEARAMLQQG